MGKKSSKEKRIQKAEIHERLFKVPKNTTNTAKKFFEMPPYSYTSMCSSQEDDK